MSTLTRTVQPAAHAAQAAAQPVIEVARVVVRVCGIVLYRWIVAGTIRGSLHATRKTLTVLGVRVWNVVAWMRWYPAEGERPRPRPLSEASERTQAT